MTTRLVLGNDKRFIHLELKEVLPAGLPCAGDLAFGIELAADGFSGHNDMVWFGRPEIDQFISELQSLNNTLQGAASLKDLSYGSKYDGFCLEVFSLDQTRQFGVRAKLRRPEYLGSNRLTNVLEASVCFEIEPSGIDHLLVSLQHLTGDSSS